MYEKCSQASTIQLHKSNQGRMLKNVVCSIDNIYKKNIKGILTFTTDIFVVPSG